MPHERLFYKLEKIGLGSRLISFIKRMYDNTFMRVKVNNKLTDAFRYERSVRQGCPTSPLLFNIYINEILDRIRAVPVPGLSDGLKGLVFADDTVLVSDSVSDLKEKLIAIREWMSDNAMEVNPSKCGIMVICSSQDPIINEVILFNGEEIPKVEKYIYLGIEINDQLNIKEIARHRLGKGKKTLDALTPTLRNFKVPLEYKAMLLKSILVPTL